LKTNQEKSRMCAVFAGCLSVVAFVLYNSRNLTDVTHPNISSWMVWACITILNFTSYRKLTGDWVKSVLPTANSIMCITTALLAIHTGSVRSLSGTDQICLLLGVIAGMCWWIFKSASFAQIILQVAVVVGFIPTLTGTWIDPSSEPSLSWCLWVGSFVAQYFAVKFTWGGKKTEFLYPVNMIVFHGIVFLLALR
jgi:hypothetical protein